MNRRMASLFALACVISIGAGAPPDSSTLHATAPAKPMAKPVAKPAVKPAAKHARTVSRAKFGRPITLSAPEDRANPIPQVTNLTFLIGNRVFPDFHDVESAPLGKEFQVGESEYTARAMQFVPDFGIDSKQHKIVSRSNSPKNPAVQMIVLKDGVPQDTSWAFANFPPHFSRTSVLAFRVVQIDFANLPSITVVPDTTAAEKAR